MMGVFFISSPGALFQVSLCHGLLSVIHPSSICANQPTFRGQKIWTLDILPLKLSFVSAYGIYSIDLTFKWQKFALMWLTA